MRKEHAPGGNARGGDETMTCAGCKKEIVLKNSERLLEKHSRKGTFHRIGELSEEEVVPASFPFHVSCALSYLNTNEKPL